MTPPTRTGLLLRAAAFSLTAFGAAGYGGSPPSGARGESEPDAGLRPGEWELSTEIGEVTTTGLAPRDRERARKRARQVAAKSRICITPAEANGPKTGIFASGNARNCRSEGPGWSRGRIESRTVCPRTDGTGTSEVVLSGRYSALSMDFALDMKTERPGQAATMATRVTGRRVGDCPAGRKGS
jgi:hypothetical protein